MTLHAARGSVLTIRLRKTATSVRIALAAPSLAQRGGRVANALLGHRQRVTVSVVDASSRRTRLSEKVSVRSR